MTIYLVFDWEKGVVRPYFTRFPSNDLLKMNNDHLQVFKTEKGCMGFFGTGIIVGTKELTVK
ncbi:hypothetical protein KHA80_13775 [Anaerobacillus sp. HL2]|nr:hypothetical protein KHA80_13775 [Anaerobacillus sp. HL2]